MRTIAFVLIFLIIGALFIIGENDLALRYPDKREKFAELYTSWIGNTFENSKSLVGYVVKLDWLPEDEASGED